jgi:hypothetical protein
MLYKQKIPLSSGIVCENYFYIKGAVPPLPLRPLEALTRAL